MISYYKDITFFTNKSRIEFLMNSRNKILEYFHNTQFDRHARAVIENEISSKARSEINLLVPKLSNVITAANISTTFIHQDAPIRGGRVSQLDLIANIFNIIEMEISPQLLLDALERAIGVYQNDFNNSRIRTFNPFWWIKRALDNFSILPLYIITLFGFSLDNVKNSWLGKGVRGTVWAASSILIFLQIEQLLNIEITQNLKSLIDKE